MCVKFYSELHTYVCRLVFQNHVAMYLFEVIKFVATTLIQIWSSTQITQTFVQTSIFISEILLHIRF